MDEVKTMRQRQNYPDDFIINMDDTPIYFDMPRSSTVSKKGAREVHIQGTKGGKTWVTYVVSCTAAGQKLKSMVFFKGKTKRCIKKMKEWTSDIALTKQRHGWTMS